MAAANNALSQFSPRTIENHDTVLPNFVIDKPSQTKKYQLHPDPSSSQRVSSTPQTLTDQTYSQRPSITTIKFTTKVYSFHQKNRELYCFTNPIPKQSIAVGFKSNGKFNQIFKNYLALRKQIKILKPSASELEQIFNFSDC